VGPETADACFALMPMRKTEMVVDAYTLRVLRTLLPSARSQATARGQELLRNGSCPARLLASGFHALMVEHAQNACVSPER